MRTHHSHDEPDLHAHAPSPSPGPRPGNDVQDHMYAILAQLGEDPHREGLRDTPKRYETAMRFLTSGCHAAPSRASTPAGRASAPRPAATKKRSVSGPRVARRISAPWWVRHFLRKARARSSSYETSNFSPSASITFCPFTDVRP